MNVELKIILTLNNGKKQELSYDDAEELYGELGKIFGNNQSLGTSLYYPQGVRSIDTVYKDAIPKVAGAKSNDSTDTKKTSLNVSATGVEDKKIDTKIFNENRDVQDSMISKLQTHEEEIASELKKLQDRTRSMDSIIENFNK